MIAHLALVLLLPAALLTWRWSRLVSGALWLTLATWLAYRGIKWQWPNVWAAGYLEWMRGVSMVTGGVGAVVLKRDRPSMRLRSWAYRPARITMTLRTTSFARVDALAGLLVASMGVDLTAWLVHRGAGQWGPQPFFQCIVLLAMCASSVWPRRKT